MKQDSSTDFCTAISPRGSSDNQYVNSFVADLRERRYADITIRKYLEAVRKFSHWLEQHHLCPAELTDAVVNRYLTALAQSKKPPGVDRRIKITTALHALLRYLRRQGVIIDRPESSPAREIEQWLARYDSHLEQALGLAPTTRQKYLSFATRFLSSITAAGTPNWSLITSEFVGEFVRQDAAQRRGNGPQGPAAATRSLLRFLVMQGLIQSGLELALPRVRRWTHAALPRPLSETERAQVLNAAADGTVIGKRNYAILLLMSRLGLRAKEVSSLRLDDFDWRLGTILIRAGKTHCERLLPLDEQVGWAVVEYLRDSRPVTSHHEVFLTNDAPYQPLRTASAITHIVQRAMARTSLPPRPGGAHLFRHSVATELVCRGASFKQVADLLGHQSLQTTAIYAKLDLNSLQQVALPWPGGVQ
jgi:site-specific recombinase XerD